MTPDRPRRGSQEPERPMAMTEAEIQVLMRTGRVWAFRPIEPEPYQDSCGGEVTWGHRDVCGLFAEHVFGACFVKSVECPYGKPGERVWVGHFVARITAIKVERVEPGWSWALCLSKESS